MQKFHYTNLHAILLLCFLLSACSEIKKKRDTPMTTDLYALPQACDFSQVGNNSSLEFECSPKLTDRFFSPFQGILINAAPETILKKNLERSEIALSPAGDAMDGNKVMVTGLLKLPSNTLKSSKVGEDLATNVVLVAVNTKTAEAYNGKMIRFGFSGVLPDLPPVADNETVSDTQEFFNIDLIQNLDIPLTSAEYTVYATLGEYKSNTLHISVKFK